MAETTSENNAAGTQQRSVPVTKVFRCRTCNEILGYTDGIYFYIGNSIFPLKITFMCAKCGNTAQWRPAISYKNRDTIGNDGNSGSEGRSAAGLPRELV